VSTTKTKLLIIGGLALLLGCVLVLRWRRDKPVAPSPAQTPGSPSYEVRVETPLFNRAPWQIPGVILGLSDRGPKLDQTTPGAKVGQVAPNHLELSADGGWDLVIETDDERRLAPGTHVAFPIELGGRPLRFDCRPADRPSGYLTTTTRAGSDEIDGSFVLELTTCKNAQSGKTAQWPAKPLTVRGNFNGLPTNGSPRSGR